MTQCTCDTCNDSAKPTMTWEWTGDREEGTYTQCKECFVALFPHANDEWKADVRV